MEQLDIISALVGLCGATVNEGKTENTDQIILNALGLYGKAASEEDIKKQIDLIQKEKKIIAPNCATCAVQCGNTSDYDLKKLEASSPEIKALKLYILDEIVALAGNITLADCTGNVALADPAGGAVFNDVKMKKIYKGILYFSYDLTLDQLKRFLDELK